MTTSYEPDTKRQPVNLTIREAHTSQGLEQNQKAIAAHNKRVEKEGTLLKPSWAE